jgi:hypothetical protein
MYNPVGVATSYRAGVRFQKGHEIFLFSTVSRLSLGPTLPPIQWVFGAVSPGSKRPASEAQHLPQFRAKVKNGESVSPLPDTSSCRRA